ncbi:hypothetical protein [Endozoicomonas lisbonensis]|uniref:Uncharacterized protein n=1 Tax=Endozoicomonas lisbonensis TaxID=3120522 RepID=A0ABV2SBA6_9GAMM
MWNPAFYPTAKISIVLRTLTFLILIAFSLNAEKALAQTLHLKKRVSNEAYPYSIRKANNGFLELRGNHTVPDGQDIKIESDSDFALCFTPKYFQGEQLATHSMRYAFNMTLNGTTCYSINHESQTKIIDYHNDIATNSKKNYLHLCQKFKPSCGMLNNVFSNLSKSKSLSLDKIINKKMVDFFPELIPLLNECIAKHFHCTLFDYFCGYDEFTHGDWTVREFLGRVWGILIDSESSSEKEHCHQYSSGLHCSIAGCGVSEGDKCGANNEILYLKSPK